MAVKDWSNPTPEEWGEIAGGIRQAQKDTSPSMQIGVRDLTEEEKAWAQKTLEEYRNRKK